MRILYLDIDTLRPDHLGCYGYHRNTSPAIDNVAREAMRFNNVYVSDAPCLPSRTAMYSGRCGIHTGVVDHAGIAADMFLEGPSRGFRGMIGETSLAACLTRAGLHTTLISPFPDRHSAWWFVAGFHETINTGQRGHERADEVAPPALDWLKRNAKTDNWFLHLNVWDAHTPYRTPAEYGEPFANDPLPAWLTDDIRRMHWNGVGPESAQDAAEYQSLSHGRTPHYWEAYPRQPLAMDSMQQVRRMFDGYDTGVRYADDFVGQVLSALKDAGVYEDTAIIISSDHGEDLGELNNYMCHMLADEATCHLPLIIRWPGVTDRHQGKALDAIHCHLDVAATMLELAGGKTPGHWDGQSFAESVRAGEDAGRDFTVISHMAGTCQRSVRFGDYLCIRSYHDGYHCYPDRMLFDVKRDPHMLHDLAPARPELLGHAAVLLDDWVGQMLRTASHGQDPLWTVIQAGGPEHIRRGSAEGYLKRLESTGRSHWAQRLRQQHPRTMPPAK